MEGGFGFLTDFHQPTGKRTSLCSHLLKTPACMRVFSFLHKSYSAYHQNLTMEYAIAALELAIGQAPRPGRSVGLQRPRWYAGTAATRTGRMGRVSDGGDSAPCSRVGPQVIEAQLRDDTSAARDALDSVQAQLAEARTTKTSLAAELALARQQLEEESSTRIED